MINNDVDGTRNRLNPNRIYKLLKDQIYYQNLFIHVTNRTETLTIVDEEGGKKPMIIMQPINDIEIGQNEVKLSIKLVNIHYQVMQLEGT